MARYFEPPARNISFVRTRDYENVLARLKDHPVVVLTGQNGIGKRWTARQVLRELWKNETAGDKRFHELDINTIDTVKADVERMLADYNLREDLEVSTCPNFSRLLLRAFQTLERNRPDFHKYCLFDVTNLSGEVIADQFLSEFLEDFCDELSKNHQNPSRWKILVVTVKEMKVKPAKCDAIKVGNFYALKGFDIENIKKMINLECDDFGDEAIDSYARVIYDVLHITLPMNVRLIVNDMNSSIEETPEDFADNYIRSLQPRASSLVSEGNATNPHARSLDVCRLNIEKCFGSKDVANRKKFCAMLSMVDGDEVPTELLTAFLETLVPKDEKLVKQRVNELMVCLKQADLCKKNQESGRSQVIYSVHPFVQEAMATFMADYNATEKLILLKNTLVALVRRMPKDGRDLHPQLMKSFLAIGHKVNECAKDMIFELRDDCTDSGLIPLIKILHCELLLAIGYCLIARQNVVDGERYFLLALDKYNEAVHSPKSYKPIYEFSKWVVQPVYDKGQEARFSAEEIFRRYVGDVPRYDVITPDSLHHMPRITANDLVNEHMSGLAFDELRKTGRLLVTSHHKTEALVLDIDKCVKVYMGELLVRILFSWSKVYASVNGSQGGTLNLLIYKELAQQAYNLCDTIHTALDVHLLYKLTTRRILLRYQLHESNDHDTADHLYKQWNDLNAAPTTQSRSAATTGGSESNPVEGNNERSELNANQSQAASESQEVERTGQVAAESVEVGAHGQDFRETEVYSSGLLRSILEQDLYHQLSCLKWQLLTIGKKRQYSSDPDLYKQQGTKQMDDVLQLISQLFPAKPCIPRHHSALSKAYRVFAEYHYYCDNVFFAIRTVICSLEHLRLSSPDGKLDCTNATYTHLMQDYDKYRGQCPSSLQPFIASEDVEAGYLHNILSNVKTLKRQNQAGEGPYVEKLHHIWSEIVAAATVTYGVSEDVEDEIRAAFGAQGAATTYRSPSTNSDSYYSLDEDSFAR